MQDAALQGGDAAEAEVAEILLQMQEKLLVNPKTRRHSTRVSAGELHLP